MTTTPPPATRPVSCIRRQGCLDVDGCNEEDRCCAEEIEDARILADEATAPMEGLPEGHTAFPWRKVRAADGRLLINGDNGFVCSLDQPPGPEQEANADLIAAIPGMMAELKHWREGTPLTEKQRARIEALKERRQAEFGRLRSLIAKLREALEDLESYSHYNEAWQDDHPEIPEKARAILVETEQQ